MGALFLTTHSWSSRITSTRGSNWQRGWSILTLAVADFPRFGWTASFAPFFSGMRKTTTFRTPLFFGLTISLLLGSPLTSLRQWSWSLVMFSASGLGASLPPQVTWPRTVPHGSWAGPAAAKERASAR